MWYLVVTVSVPSGFSSLNCARSLLWFPLSSPEPLSCALLELIITPLLGWQLLPSPSLVGSQTWCPVSPVVEGWHSGDILYYSIQWVELQGWGHLRTNPGFGEFWFTPLLLVVTCPPPTSFIERIFSGLSGVGLAWVQTR